MTVENDELTVKNDELTFENDEFTLKNDELANCSIFQLSWLIDWNIGLYPLFIDWLCGGKVMSQCSELFTTWDDEYDKLQVFQVFKNHPILTKYFFPSMWKICWILTYGEIKWIYHKAYHLIYFLVLSTPWETDKFKWNNEIEFKGLMNIYLSSLDIK